MGGYGRKDDGTTWTLNWTPENMLHTAVGSNNTDLRYVYDADGMMVQRLENEGENGEQVTVFLGKLFEHNLTFDSYRKHIGYKLRTFASCQANNWLQFRYEKIQSEIKKFSPTYTGYPG